MNTTQERNRLAETLEAIAKEARNATTWREFDDTLEAIHRVAGECKRGGYYDRVATAIDEAEAEANEWADRGIV